MLIRRINKFVASVKIDSRVVVAPSCLEIVAKHDHYML